MTKSSLPAIYPNRLTSSKPQGIGTQYGYMDIEHMRQQAVAGWIAALGPSDTR
jgi:hypothetical protein